MEMFDSNGIILYIDDEEQNLLAFRSAFRRIYEVHTALSAEQGLQILETEAIEVIITDQRMPDMTGTEFLEQIIPIYPNIIRMILTGFSDIGAIVEAINRGQVYRYINKPWNKDDLKIAIDNALDSFRLRSHNKMLVEHLQEANHNLEQKVADRTAELRKKNDNIIASITYAKRIQTAILPFEERIGKSLGKDNFFVFFQPKDIVSGDFYWLEEIQRSDASGQTETINFVAVADCTGHGVPGAFMSMIGNQLLYEIIIKNHIYSPCLILNSLHKEVHRVLRQKETQTNDGMDMAILAFQKNKNITKLEYAGAMNPLYYVQNNEFVEIKATKRSIGGSQLEEERFF